MSKEIKIHKLVLREHDPKGTVVTMPRGSRALHVAAQNDDPCLWFSFGPDNSGTLDEWRVFVLFTGEPAKLPDDAKYVGTAHLSRGFVCHVWISTP